ncbi:MAG: hypothetical protein ACTSU5_19480 [Promethearchaeota archaeon]
MGKNGGPDHLIVDDVGSFPFPPYVDKQTFAENYFTFYKALSGREFPANRGIQVNFINPIAYTFRLKLEAGIDVVNYSQLFNMHDQFLVPIEKYSLGPYRIDPKWAFVPEQKVAEREARRWYEETGQRVRFKACVTGPIELYLRTEFGFMVYEDTINALADSVNAFLKACVVKTPHMETEVVSIDEPSLGFVDLFNVTDDDLSRVLDRATEGLDCDVQIHLHTLSRANVPLGSKNIDCLTCEYASNPNNILPKRELDRADKFIRVGICRTDFNGILAEFLDAGEDFHELMNDPSRLIQPEEQIRHNLERALDIYGERLKYVGPDCGLSSWGPPTVAAELLSRVVRVVRDYELGR